MTVYSSKRSPATSVIILIPAFKIGEIYSDVLSINASPLSEATLLATFLKVALRIPLKEISGAPAAIKATFIFSFSSLERNDSIKSDIRQSAL